MRRLVARDPSRPWPGEMAGAVFKLYRAALHLQELQCEIDAYLSSQPHSTTLYSDGSDRRFVLKGHLSHEPPEMLPLIVGDCLQNMRVALDHLAWALAELGGKEPPRNTAFPIYIDRDDFHDRNKKGVPTAGSGLGKMRAPGRGADDHRRTATLPRGRPRHAPALGPKRVLPHRPAPDA